MELSLVPFFVLLTIFSTFGICVFQRRRQVHPIKRTDSESKIPVMCCVVHARLDSGQTEPCPADVLDAFRSFRQRECEVLAGFELETSPAGDVTSVFSSAEAGVSWCMIVVDAIWKSAHDGDRATECGLPVAFGVHVGAVNGEDKGGRVVPAQEVVAIAQAASKIGSAAATDVLLTAAARARVPAALVKELAVTSRGTHVLVPGQPSTELFCIGFSESPRELTLPTTEETRSSAPLLSPTRHARAPPTLDLAGVADTEDDAEDEPRRIELLTPYTDLDDGLVELTERRIMTDNPQHTLTSAASAVFEEHTMRELKIAAEREAQQHQNHLRRRDRLLDKLVGMATSPGSPTAGGVPGAHAVPEDDVRAATFTVQAQEMAVAAERSRQRFITMNRMLNRMGHAGNLATPFPGFSPTPRPPGTARSSTLGRVPSISSLVGDSLPSPARNPSLDHSVDTPGTPEASAPDHLPVPS